MSTPNAPDGWCPFATRYPTTKFWSGNQGRRAVVLHIAQGSYEGAVSWLSNADTNPNSSAHFVIAKDGRIAQLVSIWDSAWANGLRWTNGAWYTPADPPRLETPPWADIVAGVNPNLYTISVEHEGSYQDPWTPAMYAANTRLLKWVAAQLGHTGAPITWTAHRNLIGHYEIDPIDRANCPGPTVNFAQMATDANANPTDLFSQVVVQSIPAHVYGTTALVSLPGYAIVSQLTDIDVPVSGYLDYQGTRWYISQYSYQNHILNFFDSAATQPPVQDLKLSLCLNPGYRDTVTPSADELRALGPQWLRVLLFSQYQNAQTGQNTELDWLLGRVSGMNIKILALVNTETVGQVPPPHGSGWGDAASGYIGQVATLAAKIAGYYKNQIGAIEVFNEPDVQGVAPEDYGALLNAVYPQIKAVSNLPVISAGICCGENIDYIRHVAAVARGSYDYTGWHAYGERVDGYPMASFGFGELRNSLSSARTLGGKPLWITEIGAQLDWTWQAGVNSADAVAAYLTQAYNLMRTLGRNTVAQAFWFTYKIGGESWGLVDDAGNHRPAWNAFQQTAGIPPPPTPPAITAGSLSPTTVTAGQLLNISVTVKNNSNNTLATEGPDPGFVYNEGETFQTRGFPAQPNVFRIGLDFDGRTGVDHPYRWG
ncbi:MAG: peptidoglycan recognition family protein, partial [Anaerolineae bacterium]